MPCVLNPTGLQSSKQDGEVSRRPQLNTDPRPFVEHEVGSKKDVYLLSYTPV